MLAAATTAAACLTFFGCGAGDDTDPLEPIRLQHAQSDFEGSIEPLRRVLKARPDDSEANYLYGRALAQTGRSNVANWSLRKAMEDPEWLVPAGSQLAFLALAGRDFNEVEEITELILEQEPENVPVLLMRANAYAHWKKDPELALQTADRVLELDPDALEAYEPRILALLDLGRLEEATEALDKVGRRMKERETSPQLLAWHCSTTAAFEEQSGDLEQTRKTWLECLAAYPASMEVVSNAVAFYDGQGEHERAMEVLEAAFDADPTARVMRVSLADRLMQQGRAAEAEALLREATRTDDPAIAAEAWLDLGKLRQMLGEPAAAAEALGRAIEEARKVSTPDPGLVFDYADSLLMAGQLARALEVGDELTVPAHRHLIRARVAQERRNPVRALEEFDEALRLWPDNAYTRYYAALAAEEVGDFERALEEYRYSIRVSPGATDARIRGGKLLLATGQITHAVQVLHSGYSSAPLGAEGEELAIELAGFLGDTASVAEKLGRVHASWPGWSGRALAAGARGSNRRGGPALALSMLTSAPGVDYGNPTFSPALRALVRYAYEAGKSKAVRETYIGVFDAHPEQGVFQEIRALDLELSGADPATVRAAYQRAVELSPRNSHALEGMGRASLAAGDVDAAIAYFDRATAADPTRAEPALAAARALISAGRSEPAAERLDALLLEHPLAGDAAAERARLDLQGGTVTASTLDRARRAAHFGGGPDEWDLLSQVHMQLGDSATAERAAEGARRLREAATPPG